MRTTEPMLKQVELRRFVGRSFERRVVWLPIDRAVIGRRVTLADLTEGWEVIGVHEPALPAAVVAQFDHPDPRSTRRGAHAMA